jgi:uncharacterized protein (DUF433 family)
MSSPTQQRSFRLSRRTLELLDSLAAASGQSRNSIAERLLSEAIRNETHPLIRFRSGATGRRQPILAGTRIYVHQLVATLRGNDGDIDRTAADFGLSPQQVRAALAYYADFRDEVDDDAAAAVRAEQDERERWERQQQAIA